jgi:hypothetical protein
VKLPPYTVTGKAVTVERCRKVYTPLARFADLASARAYADLHNGDVRLTCESRLYEKEA